MKILRIAIICVLLITIGLTALVYPQLPDPVAAHWDAAGNADGTLPRPWGVGLAPVLMAGFTALLLVIPRIDPLRKNYAQFRNYYEGLILALDLFMAVVQLQILLWNLGTRVSPNVFLPIPFGLLFIYLGFVLEHTEQNWFVGIRTPWTLSSVAVWKKTHMLGGKLFKLAGIFCFGGIVLPPYAIWLILFPVLIAGIGTVVYSYVAYRQELRDAQNS